MNRENILNKYKEKKPFIRAMCLLLLCAVMAIPVSGVYAFREQTTAFENRFPMGSYEVELLEEFMPNETWVPGEMQSKEAFIQNTGSLSAFVRIKFEEQWEDMNGNLEYAGETIIKEWAKSGLFTTEGKVNSEYWTFNPNDGYYYYNDILEPGESVEILKSIQFASSVTNMTDGFNYANAEYRLTFTEDDLLAEPWVEAIAQASAAWGMQPSADDSGGITWTSVSESSDP